MNRSGLLAAVLAMAAGGAAAFDGPVYRMCMNPGHFGHEHCDCEASTLRARFSPADHALYERLATDYLARIREGLPRDEAWPAAVQSVAFRTNAPYAAFAAKAATLRQAHAAVNAVCGVYE